MAGGLLRQTDNNHIWGWGLCDLYLRNLIDDFNREALGMVIDFSRLAERLKRALRQIMAWRPAQDDQPFRSL